MSVSQSNFMTRERACLFLELLSLAWQLKSLGYKGVGQCCQLRLGSEAASAWKVVDLVVWFEAPPCFRRESGERVLMRPQYVPATSRGATLNVANATKHCDHMTQRTILQAAPGDKAVTINCLYMILYLSTYPIPTHVHRNKASAPQIALLSQSRVGKYNPIYIHIHIHVHA